MATQPIGDPLVTVQEYLRMLLAELFAEFDRP